jgi:glycosyltransferase involved in cell wall biosynthesis
MKPVKRANVVLLTPWYPTTDNRYGGVFVREYARALRPYCNVVVLHCGIGDSTLQHWWSATREVDEELADGIEVYRVAFRWSGIPLVSFIRYLGSVHQTMAKLSRDFGPPSVIHAHVFNTGWPALLIGRLRRIPVVISEHWTAFPRRILSRGKIYQARAIFRWADVVLPVSHALQESLEQHGVRARFQVFPNVVDDELFRFVPRISKSGETIRLLTVTSLVKHKGVYSLFRALSNIVWEGRRWHLDIVGDGGEANEHSLMVLKLGLASNVTFHGQLPKKKVAQLMQHADLFVLPSLVETFSVATAEALVSGLPVVVTRCGGPEEFVTTDSGIVVQPDDPMALALALTETIERLPTFDRSGIAKEARERFGATHVGALLYELYERLIDNHLPSVVNREC